MSNYMVRVNCSALTAYAAQTAPDVTIPFEPKRVAIVNESAVIAVFASFDGIADHARLTPGQPTQGLQFENGATKIWFKREAAGAGYVQIIAEG